MLSQRAGQRLGPYRLPIYLAVACGVGLLLAVAALRFSPVWVLGGALGILFLAVVTYKPEFGLLAIVAVTSGLVNHQRLPLLSIGPISFHVTDVILLYLVAILLTKALVEPNFKLVRTPLDVPLLWFYFAVLLSAIVAITCFSLDMNFVLRLLRVLTYYLGFFVVTNLITDKRQLTVLINGLFAVAVLACLGVLVELLIPSLHAVQRSTPELVTAGRGYSGILRTYMPAERLAYSMLLVSVCSLALGSRWLPPKVEFARAGILGIGLFLTFLRSVWLTMLSMLAMLVVLVPLPERIRFLRWATVGVAMVALLAGLPGVNRYTTAALDRLVWGMLPETLELDPSVRMRAMETRYGIQSIARHPLLGIGLGNLYRPRTEGDAFWYPDDPNIGLRWYIHNAYLWVWIDMGLIGLVPFIWLYGSFLWRGFTRWRRISDPKLRVVVLGFTLAILGQAITNTVGPNFIQSWVLIVFAIMLGINELIFRWEVSEERQ